MYQALDVLGARLAGSAMLRLMSLSFRLDPALRRNLVDGKKGLYDYVFNARLLFRTRDDSVLIHVEFKEGKMQVGRGRIERPDLTLTFKSPQTLRKLFSPFNPGDPLIMMLENELSAEGNMIFLARFGHLGKEISTGKKKRRRLAHAGPVPLSEVGTTPPSGATYNPESKAKPFWPMQPPGAAAPTSNSRLNEAPIRQATLISSPHDQVGVLSEPFLSRYTLEDFPRLKFIRQRLNDNPGEICSERPRLLTEYFLQAGFERDASGRERDPELRQAEALNHILTHRQAVIHDWDILAGTSTTKEVGVLLYPEFGAGLLWPELLTIDERKLNPYRITVEDIDILNDLIFPFWSERNVMEYTRAHYGNPSCQQLNDRWVLYFSWKPHAVSHTIPDFPTILRRGLLDLMREAQEMEASAQTEKERTFYLALQIAQEGVLAYTAHLREKVQEMAAQLTPRESAPEQRRKQELLDMAEVLARVPAYPARTLKEAVNAIWLCWVSLHMENMNAGLSLGRLDQWLQPYFLQDIARAQSEEEKEKIIYRSIESVGALFLKCADHLPASPDIGNRLFGGSSSDQALTLGGVTPSGESAVCDMTYIFLKVTEMLTLRDPNVNARYYPGVNSPEYLKRLIEVNRITAATPSLHNDAAIIPAMLQQGFSLEDARDWAATGCVEPTSAGRHFGHTNSMLLNTVAPLEMALHNGFHPLLGEQVGPETGDPSLPGTFPTFASFKEAYKLQLSFLISQAIEYNNLLGKSHQYLHPTPLLSSFIQGPIEKGKDVIEGGARYNSSGAALVSITDVVDSLMVIRNLIYEAETVSWTILLAALAADFKGYETLHALILSKIPKFGTEAEQPRQLAQELIDFIYAEYQSHENYRGGKYTSGFWSMSNHVAFGTLSGAIPSGRRKGQPFTPGITPSPGVGDQLLDNMQTVASLKAEMMPNNIAFNVKIAPGPQDTHALFVERVAAYTQTYFELGGMQLQFNIVTTETLKDAMAHPENYRWLLVRISGYNAYFIELNEDMQQEIIRRTEFHLEEKRGLV
ncbi:Pyruvate formate-lyase domain protein [Acididesulfobacillus acetoxydans]|uniref:Formate acetyltransferase 2 n=1 Tax=Acididesulfobacillus acetoxydans TaxID=1561005 RepID=A0A8S0Y414_9FIRM|nr:pyruvate formate lyase family protein [Acididesulfobacillus acetoxydans]CAA7602655.1 Pyruvate formate-lyase domain protein [Acididesulfobacillus acetoxydans]CEJ09128.1 Formate acetyltransferase 2 [Acididesulfobacillus acetoxydans]